MERLAQQSESSVNARRRLSHIGVTVSVLAIVLAGAGLRLYRLDAQGAADNESFSILTSRLPVPQMTARLVEDIVHPPLYQYALHWWFVIFGSSVFQARLLSALFGIAAVWMIYWLGAITFGRRTGLTAALLLAVSQLGVLYSQESRSYSLTLFLNILTIFFFWMAIRRRGVLWWLGFLVAAVALIQTHYLAGLTVAVLFCYAVLVRPRPVPLKWLVFAVLFLAVSFVPWLSTGIIHQAVNSSKIEPRAQPPWFAVSRSTFFRDLNRFNDGGWNGPEDSAPRWSFVAGALLFCVPALLSLRHTLRSRTGHARKAGALMAALWIVPSVLLLGFGALGMQYHIRYVLFLLAPYYVLVAHGITLLPVRLRPVHLALIALYGLGSTLVLYTLQYKVNFRDAFAELVRDYRPGDICVFLPDGGVPQQWSVYYGDRPLDVVTPPELEKSVPDTARIWVIAFRYKTIDTADKDIYRKIAVTHEKLLAQEYFSVDLALYVPKRPR